jgi:hypothetical protein
MNETFNFQRFGLLFKKTLLEQPLQTFGVLGIAMIATLIFYPPFDVKYISENIQMDVFNPIFITGTGCVAFFMFNHFSENAKGYNYLLLPSSFFEKWLIGIVVTALFAAIYLVFFRIVDTHHVNALYKAIDLPENLSKTYLQGIRKKLQILQFDSFYVHRFLYVTFIGTGAIALGNLYIKKNAFVKLCLILFGSIWAFIFLDNYIFKLFFNGIDISSYSVGIASLQYAGNVTMPAAYTKGFEILYQLIFPTALWLIALIRLREKEI